MQYVFEYDDKNRVIYTSGIDNFQAAKINYYPEQGYNEVIYLVHTNKKEFYYYDENFLVYKKVDAEGGETWYDYTANLERQLISSPNGKTIGYKFDELGNISEMIHPDGSSISYKYNNDGQITNRIDAKGNVEFWQYDNTKRLIKYLNPLGDELTYNYIDDNRLPNSLYKNGKLISEYQYNAANQLTLSTKSDSIIQQWRYDAYGRLSYFNPKESITIGLKRDTLGRVATFSQSQKSDIQISYDAYDLPIKIADNKLQMEFDYTPMGSLKKQLSYNTHDKKNTRALHFFYDDYENLIGISNEKNEKYKFIRNKRDEVVEKIEFDGTQKTYLRDADGLVTKRIDSHGTEVHYQYDVAGRLTHVVYDDADYEAYYYDASGLLIEAENQHNSVQFQRNALG